MKAVCQHVIEWKVNVANDGIKLDTRSLFVTFQKQKHELHLQVDADGFLVIYHKKPLPVGMEIAVWIVETAMSRRGVELQSTTRRAYADNDPPSEFEYEKSIIPPANRDLYWLSRPQLSSALGCNSEFAQASV